jgi:hypothetical protein
VLAEQTRPMEGVYFRIRIDHISGHRGIPDAVPTHPAAIPEQPEGWLRKIFRRP